MNLPNFNDIKFLSNIEISNTIVELEKQLFDLKFKKATRQALKSHEIKYTKRQLAQLKTLLTSRLKISELKNPGIFDLIEQQTYLINDF